MLRFFVVFLIAIAAAAAQEPECYKPGQCSGIVVGIDNANSYNKCLSHCDGNENCHWFSYQGETGICLQFFDCPTMETTCTQCFTGQAICGPLDPTCNSKGFCNGHYLANKHSDSVEDCLEFCKSMEGCAWYTHFAESQNCLLTEDCAVFEGSCDDCITGERDCQKSILGNKIFVVGGTDWPSLDSSEVIDLGAFAVDCARPAIYPTATHGMVGAFIDDAPMVCGGSNETGGPSSSCVTYDVDTDSWQPTFPMMEARYQAAAVQLSPSRWWVTGGYVSGSGGSGATMLKTTEVYTTGKGFSSFVDLPEGKSSHVLLKINSTHVMLVGGSTTNRAWTLDMESRIWSRLPDLPRTTSLPQAGVVTLPDGQVEVVVVAGNLINTTQIFSLESQTWRIGTDFPGETLHSGETIPYGNTFLMVGGQTLLEGTRQDHVYMYDGETGSWELRQRLSVGRAHLAAYLIPDNFIECVKHD